MKYRNTKSGVVIDVNAKLGGNWMPVEAKKEVKKTSEPKRKGTTKK